VLKKLSTPFKRN